MKTSLVGARETYAPQALLDLSRRFKRIILWGLTPPQWHTHFHVFHAYFRVGKLLGLNIEWLKETEVHAAQIQPDDLVFIHGQTNSHIPQVLVRGPVIVDFHVDQSRERLGNLVEIIANYPRRVTERERHEPDAVFLDPVTSYDPARKILTQPWGSDLLPSEFLPPADSHWSDKVYWIGTWWKNDSWGNYDEIAALKQKSEESGLKFVQLTDCTTIQNRYFISQSRIGASISGAGQVKHDYLACRFFKNISYGQFCISNVPKSQELLQGTAIYDPSVSQAIERGLSVSPAQARELVKFQQHCIRNYTVAAHLYMIILVALEHSLS